MTIYLLTITYQKSIQYSYNVIYFHLIRLCRYTQFNKDTNLKRFLHTAY